MRDTRIGRKERSWTPDARPRGGMRHHERRQQHGNRSAHDELCQAHTTAQRGHVEARQHEELNHAAAREGLRAPAPTRRRGSPITNYVPVPVQCIATKRHPNENSPRTKRSFAENTFPLKRSARLWGLVAKDGGRSNIPPQHIVYPEWAVARAARARRCRRQPGRLSQEKTLPRRVAVLWADEQARSAHPLAAVLWAGERARSAHPSA